MSRKYRVAYLVSHPIQYQAPLLRLISSQPDIDLTVFFLSDISLKEYTDPGFGRAIKWDIPLLGGYRHEFLPVLGRREFLSAQRPWAYGFGSRFNKTQFDVLWVHGYARWVNWFAIAAAKAAGLKVLIRDEATTFSAPRSALRRALKRIFFRALGRWTDAFLAIGTANRNYYIENGIPSDRIFLMPYCVDNEFFATRAVSAAPDRGRLRAELGLEPGRPIILFVSKFQPRKRPDDLLHAYEQLIHKTEGHPQPYLLYVGDGELREALEVEAKEKGLADSVRFLGFRNQTELPALYDLCDVYVLPSVHEPWGLIVNEVMASARSVIVTDEVGCTPDLVKSGVNGFTFPGGDVEALAEALRQIVTSADRAHAMGAASREIIEHWSFNEDLFGLRQALAAVTSKATT